jgi:hypothetical protein
MDIILFGVSLADSGGCRILPQRGVALSRPSNIRQSGKLDGAKSKYKQKRGPHAMGSGLKLFL